MHPSLRCYHKFVYATIYIQIASLQPNFYFERLFKSVFVPNLSLAPFYQKPDDVAD